MNQSDKNLISVCHDIMDNIINYISDNVYVEKNDNKYIIKNYYDQKIEKNLIISISNSEFYFELSKSCMFVLSYSTHHNKNYEFETGNFHVKIDNTFLEQYTKWLENKYNDYLTHKAKILETKIYEMYNIDKKVKRKKNIKNINKKEEL